MRRTRLRDHSINRLIPNMLTLFALCAGLTSIKFALDANALMNVTLSTDQSAVADAAARKWELAVIAIIVAAVFDALDGRIARLLDSTSKFGAELDSLSDFVAFGVAPSVVLYVWTMDQTGRIGWGCALLFSACIEGAAQSRQTRHQCSSGFNTNSMSLGSRKCEGSTWVTVQPGKAASCPAQGFCSRKCRIK